MYRSSYVNWISRSFRTYITQSKYHIIHSLKYLAHHTRVKSRIGSTIFYNITTYPTCTTLKCAIVSTIFYNTTAYPTKVKPRNGITIFDNITAYPPAVRSGTRSSILYVITAYPTTVRSGTGSIIFYNITAYPMVEFEAAHVRLACMFT